MSAARENTGCFRSGRDEKMQRGQSVTLVTVEQMVCVRRHARKQFLPPAWGRKAQAAPRTWMLASLNVGAFVCVWNSRHPPALRVFLKAAVCFQTVSPWGSCGSGRLKGLFSLCSRVSGLGHPDVCSSVLRCLNVPIPADR